MDFFISSCNRHRNAKRDIIGILLILSIGIIGQFIVSDPLGFLFPELPMLSTKDWPGSREVSGASLSDGWSWNEMRVFSVRLQTTRYDAFHIGAEVFQEVTWFAETVEAAKAWERRDCGAMCSLLNRKPDIVNPIPQEDKPVSALFCRQSDSGLGLVCYYFAYSGHWYTYLRFQGSGEDDYPLYSEMQKLIVRVDQLLLSASDEMR